MPEPRKISSMNKSPFSSMKSSFGIITYQPKSRKSLKVSRTGIEFDFYPTFTSCKPKLSWNLTKSNSSQQMNHPNWSTPTAKNASTHGADAFGTPTTFLETQAYSTPRSLPFPHSDRQLEGTPSTSKLSPKFSHTPMTSISTHCIGTAMDQPESTPQTPPRPSQSLPSPEPVPWNQYIAHLMQYLYHIAFVESTFARAAYHDQTLPQHPHLSSFGTQGNLHTPEQDYIISVTQALLNLASQSCSVPATSDCGRPPVSCTRPFLHHVPQRNLA